ncbi:hypothetical protein [Taro bacilliform CH virus]|uniref:Uncharacterized protein n=1 Tax=Taro bacilliform CH virus TaxID=1634914 RepID=A0A0E3JFY0_9VIRU|nr:hypothetical protein [Taro bacilliform CH virus]AKA45799.1 hypothetical protein [Taro bacilliform CH virus]AKA45805.1 hypothetical protein [Taro bacilliform CH virus]
MVRFLFALEITPQQELLPLGGLRITSGMKKFKVMKSKSSQSSNWTVMKPNLLSGILLENPLGNLATMSGMTHMMIISISLLNTLLLQDGTMTTTTAQRHPRMKQVTYSTSQTLGVHLYL